jgi:hypothetical protein
MVTLVVALSVGIPSICWAVVRLKAAEPPRRRLRVRAGLRLQPSGVGPPRQPGFWTTSSHRLTCADWYRPRL